MGRRGGEGIPAVVPGCRRSVTWVRSPRRAGTSAVRGARRSAADPIRGERRVCAGAQLLSRSVAGSGRLGFALGCRRVWALCNRPEPLRPLPGRGSATTSGSTGCSTRARWRSSIVRRSWSRCRAEVAIFCGSSVVLIGVRGRWRSRPTSGTAHLRPWSPLFETWDALPWLAQLRHSTRRRTPPSQQGRGSHWLFLTGAVPRLPVSGGSGTTARGRPEMATAISQPRRDPRPGPVDVVALARGAPPAGLCGDPVRGSFGHGDQADRRRRLPCRPDRDVRVRCLSDRDPAWSPQPAPAATSDTCRALPALAVRPRLLRADGSERADRARAGGRRPSVDAAGGDHRGGAHRRRLPRLAERRAQGLEGALLGWRILRGGGCASVLAQPGPLAVPARAAGVLAQRQ